MNKWKKIGIVAGGITSVALTTHIINKLIFSTSVVNKLTDTDNRLYYKWKFGDISYTKTGTGKPILLVHDLSPMSSTYEWNKIIKKLSLSRTVYTIDLMGCGYSDKPNITYTAYLYVQMLSDFIKNIIGHRTDVVVTGNSCSFVTMACYTDNSLFDKLIFVNPVNTIDAALLPTKKSNAFRVLLNSPIIGTMIYNACMSKRNIRNLFLQNLFYKTSKLSSGILNSYHESAHLYGSSAKFLFTSTHCHYTTATISHAISSIDNSISIIRGQYERNFNETLETYISLNPAIEASTIKNCRHLPQLESPVEFMKLLDIYL